MVFVRDVMTSDVVWISPRHSVNDAFATMVQFNVGHLPVVDRQKVTGLLSKKELFSYTITNDNNYNLVADVMNKDVFVCFSHNRLAEIIETMLERRIDAVPVVGNSGLAGIITTTDVLNHLLVPRVRIA